MPNVGTITGSMYLDPSAYVAGLNTAAGATRSFQQGVSTISFAGFNRGIFATTTLLYGLERIMSNMSKGMEEYANMLGRIGTVADLTAASVSALADSMKQISVYQGVSRKDIMGGMYTAAQAGYETPAEMRAMAASGARLSRASGKEIDVKKSVDLQSGIRQALGIGMGSVSSNRMNDILLRGRDIGRWELDEMAQALGIPLTVWGNQFAGRQSGEETLRQLLSVMSVASLAGVSPRMTATGTRRIVEKTLQLNKSGKVGDPLRNALRGAGFGGQEPILDALNQGGMRYLNTLMNVTGGGQTSELTRLGYGSRDLLVLTSALRGKAEKLNRTYEELSYGNAAGTTERYGEKMRQTYDYSRDRLRAQWEITSQQFMQASIPLIGQFTNMLEGFNKVAQALPESVKSFMLLIGALTAARLALNFLGFRVGKNGGTSAIMGSAGGVGKFGMGTTASMMPVASGSMRQNVSPADAQAARLVRRQVAAAGRNASWQAGFGGQSDKWAGVVGMPWGTSYAGFTPMSMTDAGRYNGRHGAVPMGPAWYNNPRREPMNWYQWQNMKATSDKWDAERAANNRKFWAPNGNPWIRPRGGQSSLMPDRQMLLMNTAALAQHYMPGQISGAQFGGTGYGPSVEARISWAAYKRGQSVDFGSGSYGSLSPAGMAYQQQVRGRSYREGSPSVAVWNQMQERLHQINSDAYSRGGTKGAPTQWQGFGGGLRMMGGELRQDLRGLLSARMQGTSGMANVIPMITSFSSAIGQTIGPLIRFGAVLGVVTKFAEGVSYRGTDREEKQDGLLKPKERGRSPSLFGTIGQGWKLAGSFLWGGSRHMEDMQRDWAEESGYTLDESGVKNYSMMLAGLLGYRKLNANDAMARLRDQNLSRANVKRLGRGGIDFQNFNTARPYLERYMTEQLGMAAPKDWDKWFQTDMKGNVQILEDAMKFYADVILRNAQRTQAIAEGRSWMSPWTSSVSSFTNDAVVRQRILSGRQWDIYSSADYSGRGNGGLNWKAGGRDYRAMYDKELENLDSRFGGFTDQSYSANARAAIENQRAMWAKKAGAVGAKFGGFEEDQGLDYMLRQGDKDFAKMQKIRSLLKVLPDIGTMPIEQAQKLFMEHTGRSDMTDVFAKANFDNFRNMDVSRFISTEQVNPPVQYAQATQFGTAEAYNQLLARPEPAEKMNIAVDKLIKALDDMRVTKAESETELQLVMKGAKRFFEQKDIENLGVNLATVASEIGDI